MLSASLPPYPDAGVDALSPEEPLLPDWPAAEIPNFSDWRLCDIVLVATDDTAAGRAIVAAQTASLSEVTRAGRYYTHAALYVGQGRVIDATATDGVAERSVWDYCKDRRLLVRRIAASDFADSSVMVKWKAQGRIGNSYGWLQLVLSKLIPGTVPHKTSMFCSTFVARVIAEGSGEVLWSKPEHKPLYPGTLAAHEGLVTVPVEWRRGRRGTVSTLAPKKTEEA